MQEILKRVLMKLWREKRKMNMNRKEEIYLQSRCPCPMCSGTRIDNKLIDWILNYEKKTGLKINITSGARCESYNREIDGYWESPHLIDALNTGHAIDFQIEGMKPIEVAFKVNNTGLSRIGIYPNHVHGDMFKPKPSKYWYVKTYNSTPIYSKEEKDLKKFLKVNNGL